MPKQTDLELLTSMLDRVSSTYVLDVDKPHEVQFVVLNEAEEGSDKFGTAFAFDMQGQLVNIESYVELLIAKRVVRVSPRETIIDVGMLQELAAQLKQLKSL